MPTRMHQRRTSPVIVWPACLVCFGVFYLGSFGPLCWLVEHNVMSEATYEQMTETVYYPLVFLSEETDVFHTIPGEMYLEYVYWWGPNW